MARDRFQSHRQCDQMAVLFFDSWTFTSLKGVQTQFYNFTKEGSKY